MDALTGTFYCVGCILHAAAEAWDKPLISQAHQAESHQSVVCSEVQQTELHFFARNMQRLMLQRLIQGDAS